MICLVTFICIAGINVSNAQQPNNAEEVRKHIIKAQTAYKDGDYNDALDEYKMALKLAPSYNELYKAIGDVYEKLGTTADITSAIEYFKRYLEFSPDASDVRTVQDKIYSLEYQAKKSGIKDKIMDDINGVWVATDNIEILNKNAKTGAISWMANFIFQFTEIQKTGTYRVTMLEQGSRYYSENLIEKTVNIVPAKDNSFTFTFADAKPYMPNQGTYSGMRLLGNVLGQAVGSSLVSDLTNVVTDAVQSVDLPSNTQTAYTFALKYDNGKLVGLVNIVEKFSDPNRQQTTGNELYEIIFVKRDENFFETDFHDAIESAPDIIRQNASGKYRMDKWGNNLSKKDIGNIIYSNNPELGKRYIKRVKTNRIKRGILFTGLAVSCTGLLLFTNENTGVAGQYMAFGGIHVSIVSLCCLKKTSKIVREYNNQLGTDRKDRTSAELNFGVTSLGGIGFTLKF